MPGVGSVTLDVTRRMVPPPARAPNMPRGAVFVAGLLLGWPGAAAGADDFFEARVRPVLTDRCVSCHGPKTAKSGLRLDSRSAVLKGGDGGLVVVPGKPADSRLVQAVRHAGDLKMPAKPLPAAEVAALEKWVELGLPWPTDVELVPPDRIAEAGKRHWAF